MSTESGQTHGALVGVVATETLLIQAFGVRGTAFAAGSVNIAAALVAAGLAGRLPRPSAPARGSERFWRVGRRPLAQLPQLPRK